MEFRVTPENVKILGRYLYDENGCWLNFSASTLEFDCTCSRLEAKIHSNATSWNDQFHTRVAVFIDDMETEAKRITLDTDDATYLLHEEPAIRTFHVKIVKLSEAAFGKMRIDSIITDTDSPLVPAPYKTRKIEFIGDSITCGYGIEGVLGVDPFKTAQENCLKAFACRSAKALDADCQLISWSANGTTSGWVDPDVDEPSDGFLIPMIYQYTDAAYSNDSGLAKELWERWDSSRFTPDVIVLNLGTNDASYTRGIPERIDRYVREYVAFLEDIRKNNPFATIFCTLGAMDQALCPAVERATHEYAEKYKDNKIHYMAYELQIEEDGYAPDNHPSEKTHIKMSKKLVAKIKEVMGW